MSLSMLGMRKYISMEDRVFSILEFLISNPLAGPSRLQYASQSNPKTWQQLKPRLIENGLITMTKKLPPEIKNRTEGYLITETGKAYYRTMKQYREAINEIKAKEQKLRSRSKK